MKRIPGMMVPRAFLSMNTSHGRITRSLFWDPTKETAARLYVQDVMKPLLGAKHVDAGIQVHASKEFLEKTEKNVNSSRPNWWIKASEVDTLSKSVLLLPDHSLFPQESSPNVDFFHWQDTSQSEMTSMGVSLVLRCTEYGNSIIVRLKMGKNM